MGISFRFYLWAKSGPRRISALVLDGIYHRRIAILQYAGTRQTRFKRSSRIEMASAACPVLLILVEPRHR